MKTLLETPYFVARELHQKWKVGDPVVGLNTFHDGSHRRDFGTEHPEILSHLRQTDGPQLDVYLELERDQLSRRLMRALIEALRRRLNSVLVFSVTHKVPRGLVDPNRDTSPDENGNVKAVRPCLNGYPDQDEIAQILHGVRLGQAFFEGMMKQHPSAVGLDLHTMWFRNPNPGSDAQAGALGLYNQRYLESTGAPRPDCLVVGNSTVLRPHRDLVSQGGFEVNKPYGDPRELAGGGVVCAGWLESLDGRFMAIDACKGNLGAWRPGSPHFVGRQEALNQYADLLVGAVMHTLDQNIHPRLKSRVA